MALTMTERANLVTLYGEPRRVYHTLDHVQRLLWLAHKMFAPKQVPEHIIHTIWYHDAVYDPYEISGRNEYESVELYCSRPGVIYDATIEAIRATKDHKPIIESEHLSKVEIDEIHTFLDLDMSILGFYTDFNDYSAFYAKKIMAEYYLTKREDYAPNRISFLKKLLAAERIYNTDKFYQLFEKNARLNIQKEIEWLAIYTR